MLLFRVIQYAIGIATSILIARALGVEGRAQYALVLNMALIIFVIAQLAIDTALGRMLARQEATIEQLARLAATGLLVLGPVAFAVAVAVGIPLSDAVLGGASTTSIVLAAATIPFSIAIQYFSVLIFRLGDLRPYGWILAVSAVVQLLLVIAIDVATRLTPEAILAATLVSVIVIAAGLAGVLSRHAGGIRGLRPSGDRALAGRAVRLALRLYPDMLASYLMLKVDLLLVGILSDLEQAGLYSLAAALADPLWLSMRALSAGALKPQTNPDEDEAARFTVKFTREVLAVSTLIWVIVAAIAYPFIVLAYGSEWSGAVLPFVILAAGLVFFTLRGACDGMLVRVAAPSRIAWLGIGTFTLNVLLNLALIPTIGIVGASLASLVTYTLSGLVAVAMLARITNQPFRAAIAAPRSGDLIFQLPRLLRERVRGSAVPSGPGS